MDDAEKGEKSEKESPSLKIDPKTYGLRAFFQPVKTDGPQVDHYAICKKEATEYERTVKKFDEDLNITLIFADLFSAVSSAFVLDLQSKREPNPNDKSAALLRTILLILNQQPIRYTG